MVSRLGVWCATGALLSCAAMPEVQPPQGAMDELVGPESWALMVAATDAVISVLDEGPAVCLSLQAGPADIRLQEADLRAFQQRRVVSLAECPRTYARMIRDRDSAVESRPAGHSDPYRLHVGLPQIDQPDHAWVE